MREPTTRRDIDKQKTGASALVYTFVAVVVIVVLAMFFWQPWRASPPAPALRSETAGPAARPTTTIVPTP